MLLSLRLPLLLPRRLDSPSPPKPRSRCKILAAVLAFPRSLLLSTAAAAGGGVELLSFDLNSAATAFGDGTVLAFLGDPLASLFNTLTTFRATSSTFPDD